MNAADCLPDRLVGREPERHALRVRLAEAIAGRGSSTVLAGESGAGKTSLAEAAAREAADVGALVLTGPCYDVSFTPLYGAWVDLFADDERVREVYIGTFTGPAGMFRQTSQPSAEVRRLHTALDLALPPRTLHLDPEQPATR